MKRENTRDSGRKQGLREDTRAQTLQDYLTGVSVLLVVIVFTFGIFPGYLDPFTAGTTGDERAQADRIARTMISNLSIETGRNTLNATKMNNITNQSEETLRDRYGLPRTAGINISVETLDGDIQTHNGSVDGVPLATDEGRSNGTAATAGRIIDLDNGVCDPGCRLVVRVW